MKSKVITTIMIMLFLASIVVIAVPVSAQPPNPVWIDVNGNGVYDTGEPSYTTIQAGIDAASTGQTIYVEPGTYTENVVVHRNVILKSTEKQEAVIVGVDVGVRTSWAWDVFRVIADGATVEGFHVHMYTPPGFPVMPSPWSGHDGIAVKADGATVRDNKVEGPGPFTSVVPSTGWGISVIPDDAAPGPEPYPWQTVPNPGEELDGVIIEGNEVRRTTGGGIFVTGTDCLIRKNKVEDTQFTGILLPPWGSKYSHDNLIAENDVKKSGTVWRLDDGIRTGVGATGNTIEANNVSGSSRDGIRTVLATGNTVHCNNITGNAAFGVRNMDTVSLDATRNWWGDPSGPYHPTTNPDGTGDDVSGYVVYEPWLGDLQFDPTSSSIVAKGTTATLKVRLTYVKASIENPVPGVTVKFSGDPALAFTPSDEQPTDTDGYATVATTTGTAGIYTVTATVCGVLSDTWTLVVYDPAGMTAGGGWYLTEEDTDTYGIVPGARATFGFVAKYIKGSATGNLEFQYRAGDINLKSTTITWLVVSGSNAQFKGTATLNGISGYYFRVIAQDNGEPGVGKDTFAIKIWNGDPDNDGTTLIHSSHNTLAGGNIMVRTK